MPLEQVKDKDTLEKQILLSEIAFFLRETNHIETSPRIAVCSNVAWQKTTLAEPKDMTHPRLSCDFFFAATSTIDQALAIH